MSQPFTRATATAGLRYAGTPLDRRREPRQPKAFAFWFQRSNLARHSAWMLDISASGAAFLVQADEAPPLGERVEFIEMQTPDRLVRDDAAPLPRGGRVLRHDPGDGLTRRVAVRLEAGDSVPLHRPDVRRSTKDRPITKYVRPAPPLPRKGTGAICFAT